MKNSFAFILCLLALQSFSQTINDKRFAHLDSAFERALKTWKCPGFAVAVVEKIKLFTPKVSVIVMKKKNCR